MIRFSFSVKKEKPTVWQMKDERPGEVHQSLRFRLSLFYVLPVAAIVIKSVSRMGRDLSLPLSHPPPLSRIVFLPLLSLSHSSSSDFLFFFFYVTLSHLDASVLVSLDDRAYIRTIRFVSIVALSVFFVLGVIIVRSKLSSNKTD